MTATTSGARSEPGTTGSGRDADPDGTARTGRARPPTGLDDAIAQVLAAGHPEELFPADPVAAARRYRRLARLLHPDAAPAPRRAQAQEAFTVLGRLWQLHRSGPDRLTITTAHGTHVVAEVLTTGDIAVLRATEDGGSLLKIPRSPADNDLMEREARALTRLHRKGDPRHRAYAPRLIETFRYREGATAAAVERRVNVLQRLTGFHSLAEVQGAYPEGLDPRDAAWMWRRLLVALGWAHRAGVVHGAVLPEHVLIHPGQHGLALVDWCYAVIDEPAGTVPALVERYRDWYPPEVPGRRPATAATDIHLASRCMVQLMGPRAPVPLRSFIRGCTLPAEARRPHDAWKLLAELDDVLERLFGPRAFRPFTMPPHGG